MSERGARLTIPRDDRFVRQRNGLANHVCRGGPRVFVAQHRFDSKLHACSWSPELHNPEKPTGLKDQLGLKDQPAQRINSAQRFIRRARKPESNIHQTALAIQYLFVGHQINRAHHALNTSTGQMWTTCRLIPNPVISMTLCWVLSPILNPRPPYLDDLAGLEHITPQAVAYRILGIFSTFLCSEDFNPDTCASLNLNS